MTMPIAGFTPTTPTTKASSGLKGMQAGDFLNLMIQQLQQQDPLNPTDSNQLLTQMSQISTLQSNTEMEQSLAGLTLQQSIGAGSNLIGKTVDGIDGNGQKVNGIVTSVAVREKNVYLELDSGKELPMSNLVQLSQTTGTGADLAKLLQNGTSNSSTGSANLQNLIQFLSGLKGAA